MKNLFILGISCAMAAILTLAGCTELSNDIDDLKDRMTKLEDLVETLDGKIDAKVSVTGTTEDTDGYTINFSDGKSIEVKHGKTPLIEVKPDGSVWVDGVKQEGVNLIGPQGPQGEKGVAPQIKVDANTGGEGLSLWYKTDGDWINTGINIVAPPAETPIVNVVVNELSGYATFTLKNGKTYDFTLFGAQVQSIEIITVRTIKFTGSESREVVFSVNPSTALIPTGEGQAIARWAISEEGAIMAETRSSCVTPSEVFSIRSIARDGEKAGRYVATIESDASKHDMNIEEYVMTLVLTLDEAKEMYVTSRAFGMAVGINRMTADQVVACDAEKALGVIRLAITGDLTAEVVDAIFGKFQNVEWLELTDFAGAIPDNFMYNNTVTPVVPKPNKIKVFRAPEVTAIGVNAFRNSNVTARNNSALRSIYFPKVTTIGERAFDNEWTIEEAIFPELIEVGPSAFSTNQPVSNLVRVDMPKLTYAPDNLFYSCKSITEVNMPNLVEAGSAFYYCGALTSISLPKLKIAGPSCFSFSTKLTEIDIPNVERLDSRAMYACNGLLSFEGAKVTSVGDSCFERCYALKEVSFPVATTFGTGCFIDCESLTKVDFPMCTAISDKMFQIVQTSVCFSTLKTIDLSNITKIGASAFEACKVLEDVGSLSKVTTVGARAFYECVVLGNVDISGITTAGDYAFFRCWGFTGELNLANLTTPGSYMFREGKNITKVTAPLLENMSPYMFADCTALGEVDMPILKKVDNFSFSKCEGLTAVDMPTVETIVNGGFNACINIKTVNLPNVKSIGAVFTGCPLITTLSLPNVETFTNGVFSGMTGLTSYDVPILATLETIPASMFQNCKSLTSIDLPAAKDLGMNAIRGCDLIESISLPNVEKVGNFVFGDNPKLKEVNLPKATTWGTNVFLNCPAIESLSFPVATSFGTLAFSGCNALKSLRFGATGAITFAANMFGANNLATIPAGCDLFLNAAGTEYASASGQTWKNYTWKSINSYTP